MKRLPPHSDYSNSTLQYNMAKDDDLANNLKNAFGNQEYYS